jgi:hypothetical protein
LSQNCNEIHGARIVDIREVKGEKRIVQYLVSNCLVNQSFVRMSWFSGWVFKGFIGFWKCLSKDTVIHIV